MDDSCSDEMREFRVEVPGFRFLTPSIESYGRFVEAMNTLPFETAWFAAPDKDARIMVGSAHPLFVSGMMALAQGHDLDAISALVEALK